MLADQLNMSNQLYAAVTETWLRDQKEAEIDIDGYKIIRQDRARPRNRRGRDSGGVALYLRDDIAGTAEVALEYSSGVIEMLGVQIKDPNLLILVIYRQPDDRVGGHRSTSVQFSRALAALRRTLSSLPSPNPDVVLCGDLNLPHAIWPHAGIRSGATADERRMIEDLSRLTDEYFLNQVINKPTHRSGNTLDLVFVNNEAMIHSYTCTPTQQSDHFFVECACLSSCTSNNQSRELPEPEKLQSLNFHSESVDWETLQVKLDDVNWVAELASCQPQNKTDHIIDVCYNIAKDLVPPRKKYSSVPASSRIPRDRKNLMRKRSRKLKQLEKATSPKKQQTIRDELVAIEKQLIKSHQQDREEDELKAVNAIKRNSKYFFSYAKKYSSAKSPIGPLINNAGEPVDDPADMAAMLADQYASVFSKPSRPINTDDSPVADDTNKPSLNDVDFDEDDFIEAISELKLNSAAGPDGFPAILLAKCKEQLAKPLLLLWRASLDEGIVPVSVKCANIIPIHKGGSRGLPKQYRPVALTSHMIKIFEKVLRKKLVEYFDKYLLFNPGQHGFRACRSCLSQLLIHYDKILEALETGSNVDVIYLDFAKAFDKVDFAVTLDKLKALGIGGKLLKWIRSFLTDRHQSVVVNGHSSPPTEVLSGVPQGSVLGPLLFLVLISDIDEEVISSFVSSFADDTRIGRDVNEPNDVSELQKDMEAIYDWAESNNMQFNTDKFECVRYGKDEELKSSTQYTAQDGKVIETKDAVRDLGIVMSCDGAFTAHIDKVCTTAKNLSSWILRTFKTRQKTPMLTLWKSLVLPHLDYCCQMWSPDKIGDVQRLESIQKSFIRKISGFSRLSYWEALKSLKLYSLQRRRERYMIIYTWRMIENQVPNIGIQHQYSKRGRRCIVPSVKKDAPSWTRKLREASLNVRGPTLFNCLPREIRDITDCKTETFKKSLDHWLSTIPDEPQIPGYTAMRRSESNCVRHMYPYAERDGEDDRPLSRPSMPSQTEAACRGDLSGV